MFVVRAAQLLTRHILISTNVRAYLPKFGTHLRNILLILLIPISTLGQILPDEVKFFENGQATQKGLDLAMFSDSPTRNKIDLAGTWEYSLDGQVWRSVKVPGSYDFTGKILFSRKFEVKAEALDNHAFALVVYGINYQSEITINGNFVGRHNGGYSSFVVQIPQSALQVGSENVIRVAVDNELTPKTTLPLRQRVGGWRTYGGIFRDIYILATPKLFIEEPHITSSVTTERKTDGKVARVSIAANVLDLGIVDSIAQGSTLGFQMEAYDRLSGELVGRTSLTPVRLQGNKVVTISAELIIAPVRLWSPDSPARYTLRCQLVRSVNKELLLLDEYIVEYGISDIRWQDGRLVINDQPTPIRGILWHEEHALTGAALTYETLEQDFTAIKNMGANLVRFLYPPHPYVLTLCDRLGLLVMEEIPLQDVPAEILMQDYYQDLASSYIKEMIGRDRNHVSVLAWGLGNEFQTKGTPACDYVNGMRNIAQSLDKRPVYYAASSPDDPCFAFVDLVALNVFHEDPRALRDELKAWKSKPGAKPLIVARYGQDIEPGNRSGYSHPLSLEAQARYAMQVHEAMKDAKIAGGVFCSYNDWRTDRPALTTHSNNPYLQSMGLVSNNREKRPAYDVLKALYGGEKPQALPVGNYSSSTPVIYVVAGLVILLAFAFLYNGNRRFRDAVNRSLIRTYNFFADVRDQRILTYGHSLFLALVISVTWATILSSVLSHYRDNVLLDNLMSHFLSDNVKEQLIYLIWSPFRFILAMSGVFLLLLLLLSVLVRILSMLVRTHIHFYHAFSVTMWSMLPFVVFIPVAMILYRLLESDVYIVPLLVLLGIVTLWVIVRLFKGVSIIYDVFQIKVYAVGLLLIVVATAALYGYFDYTRSTSMYLKYMMQAARHTSATNS